MEVLTAQYMISEPNVLNDPLPMILDRLALFLTTPLHRNGYAKMIISF